MSSAMPAVDFATAAFERGDDVFLPAFRQEPPHARLGSLAEIKALAELADRWKVDPRPWARAQLLRYVESPFDRIGHHAVVKRLFKHAESVGDDELVALFLTAFDRLVRRKRVKRWTWIQAERKSITVERLQTPNNQIIASRAGETSPQSPRHQFWAYAPRNGRLFTYTTRYYLRRRAWRYFRNLARTRPHDYCAAAARALIAYRVEDLAAGENLLDSRSLLQLLFRGRPEFDFSHADHVRLAPEASLAQLAPAPAFARLWKEPAAFEPLLKIVSQAPCRLIRNSAQTLLETHHAGSLAQLDPERILPLLSHDAEDVRIFGMTLLERSGALADLPLDRWLALLNVQDPTLLVTLCDLFAKHVRPQDTSVAQQVGLASRAQFTIAKVGQQLLRKRTDWSNADDRAWLVRLADAQCDALSGELAAWALEIIGSDEVYHTEAVTPFFDSLHAPVREAARGWLAKSSAAARDAVLWSRLLETPFDDVKRHLLTTLAAHSERFVEHRDRLGVLWSSVLLNVHRGARQKPLAVKQLGEAIAAEPQRAGEWLPVLAAAVRSIRGPERRAGLAAVATLLEQRPELGGAIGRTFSELSLASGSEARS
ncbi:MAG TPA: hypothetical protein VGE52_18630 [Pirellulales bacterium]